MSINLITGYDLNCDESGETRNTTSHILRDMRFAQFKEQLRTNAIQRPSPLYDESQTEWLYTQRREE